MVGVTPGGVINFVSETFGVRASDSNIFKKSNIIKNYEATRDSVLVDKGFLIDEDCAYNYVKLIRLPFLKDKKQFSEQEALVNKEIAAARVHVEHMNARIKTMQILNNKLEWHFVKHIDDIFIVCCGLSNLSTPIFDEDKFL